MMAAWAEGTSRSAVRAMRVRMSRRARLPARGHRPRAGEASPVARADVAPLQDASGIDRASEIAVPDRSSKAPEVTAIEGRVCSDDLPLDRPAADQAPGAG